MRARRYRIPEDRKFYSAENMKLLVNYFLALREIIKECEMETERMNDEFDRNGNLRFSFFGRGVSVQKFISLLGHFYVNRPRFWDYDLSRIKTEKAFLRRVRLIKAGIFRMEKVVQKEFWKNLPEKPKSVEQWMDSERCLAYPPNLYEDEKKYIGYNHWRRI